ncbi:MAG: ABC transporter permease [Deltaproteobacteria bacterium]|nr:ABC transporter permease [Deltaproteobacteria bacterium]MBW2086193.1 ABC transporter permease [Deltaproteobacteria bacterium]
MKRYILRRLVQAVITIIGISIIVFLLTHLSGDPVALMAPQNATKEDLEQIRIDRGLDKPIYVQYWKYISGVVVGDFGESLRWDMPAIEMFLARFPNTIKLASAAMAFAILFGLPTGILSAVKVGTRFDNFGKIFALMGQALPGFWVGIMLILLFSAKLRLLPTSGMGGWKYYIMPAFTLGWYTMAAITRLSRSAMLDVLDAEYIKMARIKGVSEVWVIMKHAFKNASAPVVTMTALQFVVLLNGTMIIETIFTWPGIGRLIVDAIFARDYPVVQMCVMISSSLFVFTNLIVDILYAYLDPRIRYQ